MSGVTRALVIALLLALAVGAGDEWRVGEVVRIPQVPKDKVDADHRLLAEALGGHYVLVYVESGDERVVFQQMAGIPEGLLVNDRGKMSSVAPDSKPGDLICYRVRQATDLHKSGGYDLAIDFYRQQWAAQSPCGGPFNPEHKAGEGFNAAGLEHRVQVQGEPAKQREREARWRTLRAKK